MSTIRLTLPPRPPSPPSGPPRGTCASRRKLDAPSPPRPPVTVRVTSSRNAIHELPGQRVPEAATSTRRLVVRLVGSGVLGERGQELGVRVALGEAVEQQLDALVGADRGKHSPHGPHHLERAFLEEQFLAAGARALDVDGGEDALLGQLAIQDQLAVAGAL